MRIRIVDAFTEHPFAGNPAGVVLLDTDSFPDDGRLQQVAAEVNLAETAFAHPLPQTAEADWALRWFTPVTEAPMCGHATLATAHVLKTTGAATGTVRFATLSGVLSATADDGGSITLDFPTASLTALPVPQKTAEVAGALGAEIVSAHHAGPHIDDLLIELADEKTVRALAPDLASLKRISHRGVIVTAAAEDPTRGYDFVSRMFAPAVGIDEDPVTGSAHTALAPYWSARFGRDELTGMQASARTGLVRTALRGDRTLLTGGAVTVIDGELLA
ncbi:MULTISPECIES: PhzF family phenazine biosynthesis protein [Streptomyces]|uniref:PhzF family phenazine biosynthesis protein n=1 Tax=Streptomyces mordarskii TaxID=1226758 RepID=A0ABN1DPJ9_9ACTN|nr:PhzF family phenazine biosynthesis protein [Streptomyces sp. AgN23]AJZ84676.1 PhzF family phenazine biosynthesis protein [Streptomyces sp. AgN23]WTA79613.1 PhzF family phenazine biosynthesis protein [Streptomyces antimycoticus]